MLGFGKKPTVISPELSYMHVFYHEDFAYKDLNELKVGRKGLSLFKIQDMDVPVPSFFVVSPVVYKEHLYKAFDKNIIELLEKGEMPEPRDISDLIEKAYFDVSIQESLIRAYSRLSGFSDAWVSVRSSVIFPARPDVSFSGLFSTELNVRGFDDLMEAIKLVYASIFTDKVAMYAKANAIKLSELQMSVVVQKMIQSEVSGTAYTVDPITQDPTRMSIEAVFGLGDVIANGEITPDQYVLNKKDLAIIEKQIAPQEWMRVRRISSKRDGKHFGSVEKIQISSSWSHQQKIEDRFLRDIAKVSLIIEDKANAPQDVEWVWESGNVWVLQSKSITPAPLENIMAAQNVQPESTKTVGEDLVDLAVGIVKSGLVEERALEEAIKYVRKEGVDEEKTREENRNSMVGKDFSNKGQNDVFDNTDGVDFKQEIKTGEIMPEYLSTSKVAEIVHDTQVTDDFNAITPKDNSDNEVDSSRINDQFDKLADALKRAKLEKARDDTAGDKLRVKTEQKQILRQETIGVKDQPYSLSYLMSGTGASFGIVTGEIVEIDIRNYRFKYVTSQNILLLRDYSPEMNSLLFNAGGVIMTAGGLTSDVAILCRELGIPAVMNAVGVDAALKDRDMVQIDGNFGGIYKIVANASEVVSDGKTVTNMKSQLQTEPNKDRDSLKMSDSVNFMKGRNIKSDDSTTEADSTKSTDMIEPTTSASSRKTMVVEKQMTATKVMLDLSENFYYELFNDVDYQVLVNQSDGVAVIDLDEVILAEKKHPLDAVAEGKFAEYSNFIATKLDKLADSFGSSEVIVAIGSATAGQMKKIRNKKTEPASEISSSTFGATRLLKQTDLLKRELMIIKRLRNVFRDRNISIAVHSPVNSEMMTDIKKEISSIGLRRTTTFNVYAILDNPAEIIMASDILDVEIDGLIINTPMIAKEMQGIAKTDKTGVYDLNTNSVMKIVDVAVDSSRVNRKRTIVLCGGSEELVKHCVREGVYGVSVEHHDVIELRRVVANTEGDIVMGRK